MIQGRCLCKAVTAELPAAPESFTVCHCRDCRTWTGGVFMSVDGGAGLRFGGAEHIGRFASSDWAERGFCKICGTNLFFRMKKSDHYFLMLGLFGDAIAPHFKEQQFMDAKPAGYSFAEKTEQVSTARMEQLLAEFLESE